MGILYDLAILGGGPAGVGAGVYAARKKLKTVFITKDFDCQSTVSEDIQNWIGIVSITGPDLAKNLRNHLLAYADDVIDLKEGEKVTAVKKEKAGFLVKTDKSNYQVKTVLVATGSYRRKLEILGAAEFESRGLTYCASCDGPLFANKDVVVIGGGNAGFETAAQLLAYAKSVTLIHRGEHFKADPVTVKKVLSNSKMKAIVNAEPVRIEGSKFVEAVVYKDVKTKSETRISVQGIFVEIGLIPTTDFVKGVVVMNKYNQIEVDPKTQKSSTEGIWAAGDCTDGLYHQNNIAAGDAIKALEDIYLYLNT